MEPECMISTDKALLDIDVIHRFISQESYWGLGRSRETVEKAIAHSTLCFGVYQKDADNGIRQIGFARVISDLTTLGYIADVFILCGYRGKGLGKRLIQSIADHPELKQLKRLVLFTRTPKFYEPAEFVVYDQTAQSKFMERKLK